MTSQELSELAKTYEETILANRLTRAEVVMLVALVEERLRVRFNSTVVVAPAVSIGEKVETSTRPTKEVPYDPQYDPPPPFEVETPPSQVSTGAILASRNQACTCNKCGKVIYVVNRDIPDNCKVSYFIESFIPFQGDYAPLTNKIEIMNVDGQISIDCPACKGSKTLYLTGKK